MENSEHGEQTQEKKVEGKDGAVSTWKMMKKYWGMQAGTNAMFVNYVLQTLKSLLEKIKKAMKHVRNYLYVLRASICKQKMILKRF